MRREPVQASRVLFRGLPRLGSSSSSGAAGAHCGSGIALVGVTAYGLAGNFVSAACTILRTGLLARRLSPEQLGFYALGMNVSSLLLTVCNLGLGTSLMRYVARNWDNPGEIRDACRKNGRLAIAWSTFVATVAAVGAQGVAAGVFGKPALAVVLRLFALTLPFGTILEVSGALLRGLGRVLLGITLNAYAQPAFALLGVWLGLFTGGGLSGALLGLVGGLALGSALAVALVVPCLPVEDRGKSASGAFLISSAPAITALTLANSMLLSLGPFALGRLRAPEENGQFLVAYQLGSVLNYVTTAVYSFFAPGAARYSRPENRDRLVSLLNFVQRLAFSLAAIPLVVGIRYGQDIMRLFGHHFATSHLTFLSRLMLCGMFLYTLLGAMSLQVLVMLGRERLELLNNVVCLAVGVVLHWFAVMRWGVTGACLATVATLGLLATLRAVEVRAVLGLRVRVPGALGVAAAAVSGVLAMVAVEASGIASSWWLRMATGSVAFCAVYVGVQGWMVSGHSKHLSSMLSSR